MKKSRLWIILLITFGARAQETVSPTEFLDQVTAHHPVAVRARLELESLKAGVMAERGAFDPKFSAGSREKEFEGTDYYRSANAGLEIPTWLGPSVEMRYWSADGVYLNPENAVPAEGLYGVGVNWQLDRIFRDERRAAVRQARALARAGESELQAALLELQLEAWEAYTRWSAARAKAALFEQAVNNAFERLEAVRREAASGFRAPIDTTEARIQWQNQRVSLQDASLAASVAEQEINTFLWLEGAVPQTLVNGAQPVLPESWLPQPLATDSLEKGLSWQENHPSLLLLAGQTEAADLERKWKASQFIPEVEGGVMWLNRDPWNGQAESWNAGAQQWKLGVKVPLFLRKERAAYKQARIKVEQLELKQVETGRKLSVKLRQAWLEVNAAEVQYRLLAENARESRRLLEAEVRQFRMGESSLFLVNSRENQFLQAGMKALDQWQKFRLAQAKWALALGLPPGV